MPEQSSIAIIGAGLSGLHLARRLSQRARVIVFEKSRGLGGRMSTRRRDGFHFDHGAQYFTAHEAPFRAFLEPFLAAGTVARWSPRLTGLAGAAAPQWGSPRYVAQPGMTALAKAMAEGLDVLRDTRVASMVSEGGKWQLTTEAGAVHEGFDWVISTAPAEQSVRLLPDHFAGTEVLRGARMQGCYSLMLGFDDLADTGWDAAVLNNSALAWIAMNHSKPGRPAAASVLCQSSNTWAQAHLEDDQDGVRDALCDALHEATGLSPASAVYVSLHRWRFAKVEQPAAAPFLLDAEASIAAAGDWCGAGRIEAAFNSADALADALPL